MDREEKIEKQDSGGGLQRVWLQPPLSWNSSELDGLGRYVTSLLFSLTFHSVPWRDYLERKTRSPPTAPPPSGQNTHHHIGVFLRPAIGHPYCVSLSGVAAACSQPEVGVQPHRVAKMTERKVKPEAYLSIYLSSTSGKVELFVLSRLLCEPSTHNNNQRITSSPRLNSFA